MTDSIAHGRKINYLSAPCEVAMHNDYFDLAKPDHFWIDWRFQIVKRYTSKYLINQRKALEIGCGTAVFANQIEQAFKIEVDACDLNQYALEKAAPGIGSLYCYNIYDANKNLLGQYDILFLMDVIEHIDDDVGFLKAAVSHCKSGGSVVVNVPACSSLFGAYDKVQGHRRRYSMNDLRQTFTKAGIEIVHLNYWGLTLLPIAVLRNLRCAFLTADKVMKCGFGPPSPLVNNLLHLLKKFELFLNINPPIGTSLLAVGCLPK